MSLSPQLKQLIEQVPQTFERYVIFCAIHSSRSYIANRNSICPWQDTGWRRDFATVRYNDLWAAIDTAWRSIPDLESLPDMGLDKPILMGTFIDNANAGGIDSKTATMVLEEIQNDLYRPDWNLANILRITEGPGLEHWLNLRISKQVAHQLHNQSQIRFLQMEDIRVLVEAGQQRLGRIDRGTVVNLGDLMDGSTVHLPSVSTGIRGLDAALGGGLVAGTGTLIAGCSGTGKTTIACQLAWEMARNGRKTVIVTTEQKPLELMQRIVANAANIPLAKFVQRTLNPASDTAQSVLNIPEDLSVDPGFSAKLVLAKQILSTNLYCLDWSQGQGFSVSRDLDHAINQLISKGWKPEVVVFDWIGGGLEACANKDHIRLYYQDAADRLITFGKKTGCIVIALAQLDKAKATNKQRTIMAMLSECKGMPNNFTNFVGLSALFEPGSSTAGSTRNLAVNQFLNVEKARNGPGGLVPVEAYLKFQRFKDRARLSP